MNMFSTTESDRDHDSKRLPSTWYEGEERQMKTMVLDDFGMPMHPWMTTVFDAATGRVVATQLSPRPMDRLMLAKLASLRGGTLLSLEDPHRWALVFPIAAEAR